MFPGLGWDSPYQGALQYEMVPAGTLPFGDHTMSLEDHLTSTTRDKILSREYVDIFYLLFRKLKKKNKEDLDDQEKECLKHHKISLV